MATLNKYEGKCCYMKTFVDSGSSCHIVTDLKLLEEKTIIS